MKALVTGGTGFVGGHVVRALLARGSDVRCLVRDAARPGALAGLDVERVVADLRDRSAVARAARGCETIYHCAADYRLWVPDPQAMHDSNVLGTRHVFEAAADAGVRRVVYTSSVGALGHRADGGPADETTPVHFAAMIGPYKRTKFLAEREAEAAVARGLDVVIVNPSTPVGERDVKPTATGQMIVDFLAGRMRAYVATGLNLVDVRDVAAGHLLAAERGRTGERYILGCRNMTLRAIFEALAAITGATAPRLRVPHWLPLAVAAVESARVRAVGGHPRVSLDAVRLSRRPMFFDAAKAVRELDFPQSPVEAALERAVRWFHDEGYAARGQV
jgi:dihydroflavonol-4-reductase